MKNEEKRIISRIRLLRDENKAAIFRRFFKTGKGEYGEGDVFWGVQVPEMKKIASEWVDADISTAANLLENRVHEVRFTALQIMNMKYARFPDERDEIYGIYLDNTRRINNWDLVDCSCYKIVGEHLLGRKRNVLYALAKSENLWERRISVVSTFAFIKNREYEETLKISKLLLHDTHDLMHKAVGWMLREVGKRCGRDKEEIFLKKYHKVMPRTMLRYSLEHFEKELRDYYMYSEGYH